MEAVALGAESPPDVRMGGPPVVSHGRPPQQPNTQPLRFAGASPIGFLHIWLRLGAYMLVVSQERHRLAGLFSEGKYRLYRRIRTMAYSRRRGLKPAHLDCCSVFEAYQFEGHGGTQE